MRSCSIILVLVAKYSYVRRSLGINKKDYIHSLRWLCGTAPSVSCSYVRRLLGIYRQERLHPLVEVAMRHCSIGWLFCLVFLRKKIIGDRQERLHPLVEVVCSTVPSVGLC